MARRGEEMLDSLEETIKETPEETLVEKIIPYVIDKGYDISALNGKEYNPYGEQHKKHLEEARVISIKDPNKSAGCLNILYALLTSPVKDHIGDLYLEDEKLGAERDKRWVLHVYGSEYTDYLYMMAEKLEKEFGVCIEAKQKDVGAKPRLLFP